MSPVDLTRERWRRLVHAALMAAASAHLAPADLGAQATAMRETASPLDGAGRCACNTLRWACLWFAEAGAASRVHMAASLTLIAEEVGRMLDPAPPPPEAAAAALPVPPAPPEDPAWIQRADCGRG